MKPAFQIVLQDGRFYELCEDEFEAYELEVTSFDDFDKPSNNSLWSMSVRGHKQRKHHPKSLMCKSITAMLENVKAELFADPNASVLCLTPDVEIEFFKG